MAALFKYIVHESAELGELGPSGRAYMFVNMATSFIFNVRKLGCFCGSEIGGRRVVFKSVYNILFTRVFKPLTIGRGLHGPSSRVPTWHQRRRLLHARFEYSTVVYLSN